MKRPMLTATLGGILASAPIVIAMVVLDWGASWFLLAQVVGALTAVALLDRAERPRRR